MQHPQLFLSCIYIETALLSVYGNGMLVYVGAGIVFAATLILAFLTGKRSASDELAATLLETTKKVRACRFCAADAPVMRF